MKPRVLTAARIRPISFFAGADIKARSGSLSSKVSTIQQRLLKVISKASKASQPTTAPVMTRSDIAEALTVARTENDAAFSAASRTGGGDGEAKTDASNVQQDNAR